MVKIRKARLKDLYEIVEIWKRFMDQQRELGREMGEDLLPEMKENAPEIFSKYISSSIRSRHGFVLVLEDSGKVRGYMLSRIQKNIPVFDREYVGYVSDIFIEEQYRGQEISSKIWELTLDWFKSKGIKEISIRVLFCNPTAHDIYAHWGFKDVLREMRLDL